MNARVPSSVIQPFLARYVQNGQTAYRRLESKWNDGVSFADPLRTLAMEARMPQDTLYRVLKGRQQSVTFDVADALLCAMGCEHLWHFDPLLPYYEGTAPKVHTGRLKSSAA